MPLRKPLSEIGPCDHLYIGTVGGYDHFPVVAFNEADEILVHQVIVPHVQIAEDRHFRLSFPDDFDRLETGDHLGERFLFRLAFRLKASTRMSVPSWITLSVSPAFFS
jgi:hypothetical protein